MISKDAESNNHKKKKRDKLGFSKMKSISSWKENTKKMNMQTTDWEKIFEIYIYEWQRIYVTEDLYPNYKGYLQLNVKKTNNQLKIGQKTWLDIWQRKIYKWPKGPQSAQHC